MQGMWARAAPASFLSDVVSDPTRESQGLWVLLPCTGPAAPSPACPRPPSSTTCMGTRARPCNRMGKESSAQQRGAAEGCRQVRNDDPILAPAEVWWSCSWEQRDSHTGSDERWQRGGLWPKLGWGGAATIRDPGTFDVQKPRAR